MDTNSSTSRAESYSTGTIEDEIRPAQEGGLMKYAVDTSNRPRWFRDKPLWVLYMAVTLMALLLLGFPLLVIVLWKPVSAYWPIDPAADFEPITGELFRFFLISCSTISAFYLTLTIITMIPYVLRRLERSSGKELITLKGQEALKYIIMSRYFFAAPMGTFIFWILVVLFVGDVSSASGLLGASPTATYYLTRVAFAMWVFSLSLLGGQLVVLRTAISYHYDYYSHRVSSNLFGLAAVRRLRERYPPPEAGKLMDDLEKSLNRDEVSIVSAAIFRGLCPPGRSHLIADDFGSLFNSKESQKLFPIFDRDGNGDLTLQELSEAIMNIYSERDTLLKAMFTNDDLIRRLDNAAFWISSAVTLTLCLPIFDVSLAGSIVTVIGFMMMAKSIFGNALKDLFNSLVFIFVTHPFDVGDTILVGKDKYKVKNIGWNTSSFYGDGKRLVYLSNSYLAAMDISNYRRSGPQTEVFPLTVAYSTPREKLMMLEKKLNEFVASHPRDFEEGVLIEIPKISHSECMQLAIPIQHRSNFQSSDVRTRRRNMFVEALLDAIKELKIELAIEEY